MATSAIPTEIGAALDAKRRPPEAVLDHIEPGADLIVGLANAEPMSVLDAIEAASSALDSVQVHQMFPLRERRYMHGEHAELHHVSWFLSPVLRDAFHKGTCSLVPNHFSEVPDLLRSATKRSLALAAASPPDRHGYFSLGCHAEYVAALIGDVPFFLEANPRMPRTFGENQVHVSDVVGWCEADYPLIELPDHPVGDRDVRIAELGVHTELLADGFVDLVEAGAITGTRKQTHRNKIITTSALGKQRLYDFVADNPGVEFWPVSYTNDPRNIGREDNMRAINASLEVDFLGQCASESLGSEYWSSSGGQPDFARGVLFAENGASFIVLHSTTTDESTSRIVSQLHPGAAVTSHKNVVDHVVTEYGVAELRGRPIGERARELIRIAHPKFRDELQRAGRELGFI